MTRFTVFAMLLVGACVASGSDTGDDGVGGGGSGEVGGGSGGSGTGSGSTGSGSGGTHGSMLPADLVGTWQYVEANAAIRYQFTADGQVLYASDLVTYSGCEYETQTSYTGTVTLQGNLLTLTPVDGTQIYANCGSTSSVSFTKVEVDAYEIQNGVLYLENQEFGTVLTLTHL